MNIKRFFLTFIFLGYPATACLSSWFSQSGNIFSPVYYSFLLVFSALLIILKGSIAYINKWTSLIFFLLFLFSIRVLFDVSDIHYSPSVPFLRFFPIYLLSVLIPAFAASIASVTFDNQDIKLFSLISSFSLILSLPNISDTQQYIESGNLILEYSSGRYSLPALNSISLSHLAFLSISATILSNFKNLLHPLRPNYDNILNIGFLFFGFYSFVLAFSRGPLFGFFLIIVLVFNFQIKNYILFSKSFVLFLRISLISIITFLSAKLFILVYDNIDLITSSEVMSSFSSVSTRFSMFSLSLENIISNPLFGFRYELPGFGYPHNVIIEYFLACGVVLGFLFLILLCYLFLQSICFLQDFNIFIPDHRPFLFVSSIWLYHFFISLSSGSLLSSHEFLISSCILINHVRLRKALTGKIQI